MCTLSWENKKLEVMGTLINGFFLQANLSLRRIYGFEAIDLMVNTIVQCFDQSSFDTSFVRMESLLVKTLNSQDNSTELQFMEKVYSDDGKWKFSKCC